MPRSIGEAVRTKNSATATWIDSEEKAYVTYHGGHSRSSRKAMALCEDGKVRYVTCGVADTFFSVPAHTKIRGHYVSGYVGLNSDRVYVFTVYAKYNKYVGVNQNG